MHWAVIAGLFGFVLIESAQSSAQPRPYDQRDWAKIVEAAKQDGKVVIYTISNPSVNERIRTDFQKVYPDIAIEIDRFNGTEAVTRAEMERDTGTQGADIVLTVELLWLANEAKRGELKIPIGPASKGWPEKYLTGGAAPILSMEPQVIGYNSNLVKDPITGYRDLLKPEFKGRLATIDPNVTSVMVAWYDWLQNTLGSDFIPRFVAQEPKLFASSVQSTQATAAGEFSANALTNATASRQLLEQGAPLKLVIPKPAYAVSFGGGVLAWSKRINAALVVMDYLMSERGQASWNGHGESASPRPGVPGSLNPEQIDSWNPAAYPPEVINMLKAKWQQEIVNPPQHRE